MIIKLTALGTEFNVNAYPENSELMATLLEGSVKVEFNNLLSNIILKPNEQLVYDKHTKAHNLRMPEIDDVTAWQRGNWFLVICIWRIFLQVLNANFLMLLYIAFIA